MTIAVLEPNQAMLMGRERYKASARYGFAITAYVSDSDDRMAWGRCFEKLRKIRQYEADWNDEGAEPLRSEVLSLSFGMAKALKAKHEPGPTRCFATDEGHVVFAWEDGASYFELEIDEDLCCTARWLRPGAKRAETAVINSLTQFS